MSAPRLRPVVTPILGVVAAALCAATALICAGAALADSKPRRRRPHRTPARWWLSAAS